MFNQIQSDSQMSGAYAATEEVINSVGGVRNVGVIAIRNAVQEVIKSQFEMSLATQKYI